MKKQTIVYALVLVLSSLGLWGVLRVGSRLQAAADLTGQWTFESGPLGPEADGPERLGKGFTIDQSGKFLRVRFDNGRQIDLRANQLPTGNLGDTLVPVELAGSAWKMSGTVRSENGKLIGSFTLRGPERARFVAYRLPQEAEKAPAVAPATPAGPSASADLQDAAASDSADAIALSTVGDPAKSTTSPSDQHPLEPRPTGPNPLTVSALPAVAPSESVVSDSDTTPDVDVVATEAAP